MKCQVFFFSGTGNSRVVARSLAAELEGRCEPLAAHVDRGVIRPAAVSATR
jgi:flavodoxin